MSHTSAKPDYGWDAPYVTRNLLIAAAACLIAAVFLPEKLAIGPVIFLPKPMLYGTATLCLIEVLLFWHYVKRGKFRHRDFILGRHTWRGDERVLDVGCGRGLLLAGAARRAPSGHATGIDIWNAEDLSGNSIAATQRNLELEGVAARCSLLTEDARAMSFPDASFDLVVSNLCLHNIYDRTLRKKAISEISRVLRPGGVALLSDYKLTAEYAAELRNQGLQVERRWGNMIDCFPPMRVVIARKMD
jgi:arsenite methyltransferase